MVSRAFLRRVADEGVIYTDRYKYVASSAQIVGARCITVRRWKMIPLDRPHSYVLDKKCEFVAIFTIDTGWMYYTQLPD